MHLLVVGAGTMGRWVARTVEAEVAFADADRDAARRAAAVADARTVPLDGGDAFDAVCVAVPISATADAIAAQAHRAERAIFDVAGIMAGPLAAMDEHAPDRERASLHPLFAPENAPGNVALAAADRGPVLDRVLDDLAAAGNEVFETTAAEHDAAMETVQAAAHTAVLAYALAAEEVREEFATPVSAGLDELVATVAGGDPGVYREIQAAFAGADAVADAARRVADADGETFDALYRAAGEHAAVRSGPDSRVALDPDAGSGSDADSDPEAGSDADAGSGPDTDADAPCPDEQP